MSGYPYGGHPQYPPPQNPIYPQLYNPSNAQAPTQPSAPGYPGQPGQPHYAPQPGFAYPYPQPIPGQPTNPAAMSYPGIAPTHTVPSQGAPSYGYPGVTPGVPTYPGVTPGVTPSQIEWRPATVYSAASLTDQAIVAGYEGYDGSPLWVIRARFEGDLIPGKLAIKHNAAYVPWGGKENSVQNFEVCCARPETVRWVESRNGSLPPNAVVAGNTSSGELLYVGRAKKEGALTPGKVHPSHKVLYIPFAGEEHAFSAYEVLCTV